MSINDGIFVVRLATCLCVRRESYRVRVVALNQHEDLGGLPVVLV